MMETLRYMLSKLQEEKGEVSVEWVLVAVIMMGVIVGAFSPGVTGAITAAMGAITAAITGAS